jgi:hypothetical protein
MPTGYTADVASGKVTTLRQFAMECARAFGACITLRDEPASTPIPEAFERSDYHIKEKAEAEASLVNLYAMTANERATAAEEANKQSRDALHRAINENDIQRQRYDDMLTQVRAWSGAPEGLQKFMLEQLADSKKFDTSTDPGKYYDATPLSTQEWFDSEVAKFRKSLAYHTEEYDKECARVHERNAWLRQLRKSLDEFEAAQ